MSHNKRRNKRYSVRYVNSLYPYTAGWYRDDVGRVMYKHEVNIHSCYNDSRKDLVEEFTEFFIKDNNVFKRIVKDLTKVDYNSIKYNEESYDSKYTGYYSNIDKWHFEIKVFINNEWRDVNAESLKHEVFNRLIRYKYYPKHHINRYCQLENGHWVRKSERYKIKKHSKYDHWDKHAYKHFDIIKEVSKIK